MPARQMTARLVRPWPSARSGTTRLLRPRKTHRQAVSTRLLGRKALRCLLRRTSRRQARQRGRLVKPRRRQSKKFRSRQHRRKRRHKLHSSNKRREACRTVRTIHPDQLLYHCSPRALRQCSSNKANSSRSSSLHLAPSQLSINSSLYRLLCRHLSSSSSRPPPVRLRRTDSRSISISCPKTSCVSKPTSRTRKHSETTRPWWRS